MAQRTEEENPKAAEAEDDDAEVEDAELLAEVAEDIEVEEEAPPRTPKPEEAAGLGDLDALGT
jgi:hypothetical protein